MIEINLLPGARRKRAGAGMALALPDFKALLTAVKEPWLIACVAGWTIVLAGVGILYLPRRAQVGELGPELERAKREARRLEGVLRLKRSFEAQRDSLLAQIEVIRDIDGDRYVWPHLLDAVTKALPPYTWLDDIAARPADADTGGGAAFQITGKSVDLQAITRFLRNLEESPFIEGVTTVSTGVVSEQGRDVTTFVLNARYQVPDSTQLTLQPLAASLVQGVRSGGGRRR
jgi:Tfp pilus assembly protein PilN